MPEPVSVTVFPDGPLKISNAEAARYCGEPIDASGDLFICRCGDSTNAPFCDGSHRRVGFQGESADPPDQEIRVWEGETLRTHFNKATCMHVFYCKPLNALRERELAGDAAAAAEIMRVVDACPSGALSYELKVEQSVPAPVASGVCVDIIEGGEVRLQTDFEINAPLNERQASDKATLCRCGRSQNKPWCDGRHRGRRGFR